MLVDRRLDAQLSTMFMVDYQPRAVAHPHDHPFEEAYYMLDGEVDVVAEGARFTLAPGDVFWRGVGTIHAFYETAAAAPAGSRPPPPARRTATPTASSATGTTSRRVSANPPADGLADTAARRAMVTRSPTTSTSPTASASSSRASTQ